MQYAAAEEHVGTGILGVDGRFDLRASALEAVGTAADAVGGLHARLLSAQLPVCRTRTVTTSVGPLGLFTAAERSGTFLCFHAGAAVADTDGWAIAAAAYDALLAPHEGSILRAGATRLVHDNACRGAMVADDRGVYSIGMMDGLSRFVQFRDDAEPGDRLAVGTPAGEFRAFSAGRASVALAMGSGAGVVTRVERWFDELEAALS